MAEGGRERGLEPSNPATVPARGSAVEAIANAIWQSFATSGSQLAAPPRDMKVVRNQLSHYVHLPFCPLLFLNVLALVHPSRPSMYMNERQIL